MAVAGILPNNTTPSPSVRKTNLTFVLDSKPAGAFRTEAGGVATAFNVLFFSATDLSPSTHLLEMTLEQSSFVLVDYLQYSLVMPVARKLYTHAPKQSLTVLPELSCVRMHRQHFAGGLTRL